MTETTAPLAPFQAIATAAGFHGQRIRPGQVFTVTNGQPGSWYVPYVPGAVSPEQPAQEQPAISLSELAAFRAAQAAAHAASGVGAAVPGAPIQTAQPTAQPTTTVIPATPAEAVVDTGIPTEQPTAQPAGGE